MSTPSFEGMQPMTREDWYNYLTDNPPMSDVRMGDRVYVDVGSEILEDEFDSTYDDVNSPSHYKTFPDAEAIDIIERTLTTKEYIGYLKGNILKYRLRAGNKNNLEKDIAKAEWYKGELFAVQEQLDNAK